MIKLRTTTGNAPATQMRYEWPRDMSALLHDAAVAHALMLAIEEAPTANWLATWLKDGGTTDITELYRLFGQRITGRAKHILRTDFGIEDK